MDPKLTTSRAYNVGPLQPQTAAVPTPPYSPVVVKGSPSPIKAPMPWLGPTAPSFPYPAPFRGSITVTKQYQHYPSIPQSAGQSARVWPQHAAASMPYVSASRLDAGQVAKSSDGGKRRAEIMGSTPWGWIAIGVAAALLLKGR